MKKLASILLILAFVVALSACSGKKTDDIPKGDKELNKYSIEIDLEDNLLSARLKTSLSYTNNTGGELNELKFHIYPETYRKDSATCAFFSKLSAYGGIDILSVAANDALTDFEAQGTILTVKLPSPLPGGEKVTISIDSGLSVPKSDLRFGLNSNVLRLANFYPVICVYEGSDWRADKYYKVGNPFYTDIADYEVKLTCPENLVVASTGVCKSEGAEGGRKTLILEATSVRDFAIAASKDFKVAERVQGGKVVKYYYTGLASRQTELETAAKALEAFSEAFGGYPYPAFTVVEAEFYYGSAGFGNLAIISKSSSDKKKAIVLETAAQWFGGIVGSDQVNSCWQHGALSAFLSRYHYYLIGDKPEYERQRGLDKSEYTGFQAARQKDKPEYDYSINKNVYKYATNYEYWMLIYKKGGLMFDACLDVLGKDKMNKALKTYVEAFAFKNPNPAEMLGVFDKASKQSVSRVIEPWLTGNIVIAGIMETPAETVS
ncbi:MAG: M1 family metallopeptidase [Clostridiales bacterium]|jgi:hypothetical protein|nr:M1 family metallopeptidase [Clostridiales bacterium]HOB64516.1 M1 family metallopeptidase [Clostridia bacterium]HOK82095.1 M1 family metallopeptidase [Clostridia bacterium]HOL61035.1 M1 family metallopeptidase [Clostridia bacterium]HPO53947.1 M1 family metallopeptidase [Clostridia bacterium]